MRVVGMVVVALLASCGSIFDLERVTLPDGAIDLCWAAERMDNEDGDDFRDGCDPCPADPTFPADADADGDGVADACDPDGATASKVVEFDGFTTPLAWVPVAGAATWMFSGGRYEVANTTGQSFTELAIPLVAYPRVDAIFASTDVVAVYMRVGASMVQASCAHEPRGAPTVDQLVLRFSGIVKMAPLDAGGTGRLQLGIDADGSVYCFGDRSGTKASLTIAAQGDGTTTASIGLIGTVTQFHSVAVFGRR